jgi:hypothetical protein
MDGPQANGPMRSSTRNAPRPATRSLCVIRDRIELVKHVP